MKEEHAGSERAGEGEREPPDVKNSGRRENLTGGGNGGKVLLKQVEFRGGNGGKETRENWPPAQNGSEKEGRLNQMGNRKGRQRRGEI